MNIFMYWEFVLYVISVSMEVLNYKIKLYVQIGIG